MGVGVPDGVAVGDGDAEGVAVGVGDDDGVAVGVGVPVCELVCVGVGVGVPDGVAVGDGEAEGVAVGVGDDEGVAVGVGDDDGVAVGVTVPVCELVCVGVGVGVPDGVPVGVGEADGVAVGVGELDGVAVGVIVAEGDADAVFDLCGSALAQPARSTTMMATDVIIWARFIVGMELLGSGRGRALATRARAVEGFVGGEILRAGKRIETVTPPQHLVIFGLHETASNGSISRQWHWLLQLRLAACGTVAHTLCGVCVALACYDGATTEGVVGCVAGLDIGFYFGSVGAGSGVGAAALAVWRPPVRARTAATLHPLEKCTE